MNLLDLYKNIRGAINLHGIEGPAELTVGRFGGIHVRIFYHLCYSTCLFSVYNITDLAGNYRL